MSVTRFHVLSPLSPDAAMAVLTDFSPRRAETWPGIDADHFEVHGRGEGWAEVTEGNAAAWERGRYEWDIESRTATLTTHESKLFGAGGGWDFRVSDTPEGARIDVTLTREPRAFGARILAGLLPIIGAPGLKKSFAAVFSA